MAAAWMKLWHGLGWFFRLLGYGKKNVFAKCVWGIFAVCLFVVVVFSGVGMVCSLCRELSREFSCEVGVCSREYCWRNTPVCGDICYHESDDENGYIYNKQTRKKLVRDVEWIAMPQGDDSLVCFSDGEKRGYFSKYTGRVVVEPKYTRAWVFSEGLACVEENGYVKFINTEGKVVIDRGMLYVPEHSGRMFHHGYCIVEGLCGKQYGLMDKQGQLVLPMEHASITHDWGMWVVQKDGMTSVLDSALQLVLPPMEGDADVDSDGIIVTMSDHTMRRYSHQGVLIHDFLCSNVCMLEYEEREVAYRTIRIDEYEEPEVTEYHPKGVARLCAYTAGDGYQGLMTPDGQVVTMPLYMTIEAIGPDLYLCGLTWDESVLLDGKGNVVK